MRAVCVDDEELVLQLTVALCGELKLFDEVKGFNRAADALDYLRDNPADIAMLDIDMPDINGIALSMKIKNIHPETAILFITGYSQYAVDAFAVHASGYLLKPVSREQLAKEVEYALSGKVRHPKAHVLIRTFGYFDVFVDGEPVKFARAKAREVLAFLVDRQGLSVNRKIIFAALWEDEPYDRSKQKQLDVIIRSLRKTLSEYGIGDIVEHRRGTLRIVPEKVECDLYQFFKGNADAVNSYNGEYMSDYSWAGITEAYMDRRAWENSLAKRN